MPINEEILEGVMVSCKDIRTRKVKKLIKETGAKKILDIGCSDGRCTAEFIGAGCQVSVTDINTDFLKRAAAKGLIATLSNIDSGFPCEKEVFDLERTECSFGNFPLQETTA